MAVSNDEVAAALTELAELTSISGGDAFKARAYEKAARAVAGHQVEVRTLDAAQLRQIPGVGKAIADKIVEFCHSGTFPALEMQRTAIPAGLRQLIDIPTLGPKKALVLYQELGITSVDELVDAVQAGRLDELRGFGPKTAENIMHGVEILRHGAGRVHLDVALSAAEQIVEVIGAVPGCTRCAYAGSLRRFRETIGDVDVLAAADDPKPLMRALKAMPDVADVIASGPTKTSIRTTAGLQVDLRVVPPESWGAAMQYFTGSKAHNVGVRTIAVRAGLKLSEYGLFDAGTDELIASRTEEELYERLGLQWVPPPMREDRGEIAAAQEGTVPGLVTESDIRGDLHTHTDLTDGIASLPEMVQAAAERGYAYFAITDHAPNLYMQQMSTDKMLEQRQQVRELNRAYKRLRLLHGTELNIDPDGGVDWADDILAGFDVCVASVHSHFNQPADAMTRRLIKACENPYIHVIGHPSTRILGRRGPVAADWDAVFRAAARTGTAFEINASPNRLDLNDEHIIAARAAGVKFAVNTDAHAVPHLDNLRYGVGTAQRGWLTPDDVINTWPLRRLQAFLRDVSRG
ncbi:DNA polymerase/3'-5' exonuclease PolX [Actinospica robiniae]|uniref:DNA polymerase/3'-5' exonuclease PolX n=1 Tax=Actinospica robiniae TaxID=304901 RepID=UPI000557E52A|nr:DNA polymerase/3'-5' exonuclease PolX [Actinospica robiniae]